MKQDRFLLGILIGIGVLIVLALLRVLFFHPQEMTYGAEDTPQGVVHNYLVAIYRKDYARAYSYLADKAKKPDAETFRNSFITGMVDPKNAMAQVGNTEYLTETEARVEVIVIYSPTDPFATSFRSIQYALLRRQNGAWKIESMPYPFWDGSWYEAIPLPPGD